MPRQAKQAPPSPMSGAQIGRLFVKDFVAQALSALDSAERSQRLPAGARVPDAGALTSDDRQRLTRQLSTGIDIEAYNHYVEILGYLQLTIRSYQAHQALAETAYLKSVLGLTRVLDTLREQQLAMLTPAILTQSELPEAPSSAPYAVLCQDAPTRLLDAHGHYCPPTPINTGFELLAIVPETGPALLSQVQRMHREIQSQIAIHKAFEVLGERIQIPALPAVLAPITLHLLDTYNDFVQSLRQAIRDIEPSPLTQILLSAEPIDPATLSPTEEDTQRGRDAIRNLSFFVYRNDLHRIIQGEA